MTLDYWGMAVLFFACFLLGGSSRADVQSLVYLQPVAFTILLLAWQRLGSLRAMGLNPITQIAGMLVAVPLLQLVPLPSMLWSNLPGREVIVAVEDAFGIGHIWRSLSLTPSQTVISLLSLAVPVSVLFLSLRLGSDLKRTPWIVAGVGVLCFVVSLAQSFGSDPNYLRPYEITNPGEIVGLFANRNHQAVFFACLMLCIAYLGSTTSSDQPHFMWIALGAWILVFMMLVISASRAGLLLGILAIPLSWSISAATGVRLSSGRLKILNFRYLAVLIVFALLVVASILDRSASLSRLAESAVAPDTRWSYLGTNLQLLRTYWATGSGIGTYELVARIYEPDALLSEAYMNQAHNDWLQVAIEGGIPAVVVIVLMALMLRKALAGDFSRSAVQGHALSLRRLGGGTLALIAIASITDYPLRTPAFAAFGALAIAWVLVGGSRNKPTKNQLP